MLAIEYTWKAYKNQNQTERKLFWKKNVSCISPKIEFSSYAVDIFVLTSTSNIEFVSRTSKIHIIMTIVCFKLYLQYLMFALFFFVFFYSE